MGDVLLMVPVLKKLLASYPGIHLTVVVNQGTEYPLLQIPGIKVVVFDNRSLSGKIQGVFTLLKLSRERIWDGLIDWTVSDRTRLVTRRATAKAKVLAGWESDRGILPEGVLYAPVDLNHGPDPVMTQYERSLGQAGFPVSSLPDDPSFPATDEARSEVGKWKKENAIGDCPILLLFPGARHWFKRWPPDRFGAIGHWWVSTQKGVVVIAGSAEEMTLIESVQSAMPQKEKPLVVIRSIPFLHALMEVSAAFVGNDSGPFHLADAAGLSGVALFGSTMPSVWGPFSKDRIQTLYHPPSCSPCVHDGCTMSVDNCLQAIRIEEVKERLLFLLAQRARHQALGEKT